MKKQLWTIRLLTAVACLAMATSVLADDTICTERTGESRYDKRVHRYRRHWGALIPTQFVLQNAGNMGALSLGAGWDYGHRRQWETDLLFGYMPAYNSSRGKFTTTIKQNYIPWSIYLDRGWSVEPLTATVYLNTVYGHEFWRSQPGRYPDKYYNFLSTKFRLNIGLGQRVSLTVPENRRKFVKAVTAFYEVSTCDLYIRAKFQDHSVKWKDILGLSLGVKLQLL